MLPGRQLGHRLFALVRTCAVAALPLFVAPRIVAQSAAVWQHDVASPIRDGIVLVNGSVAVLTDSGLTVLAHDDGRELWRQPAVCCLRGVGLTDFVVALRPDRGAVLDLGQRAEGSM